MLKSADRWIPNCVSDHATKLQGLEKIPCTNKLSKRTGEIKIAKVVAERQDG